MQRQDSFIDVLRQRVRKEPEQVLFRFLERGEEETAQLTASALDRRARYLSQQLASRTRPGDRVLIVQPPGLDFVVSLFGCFAAGVIAVPAPPPRPHQSLDRLQAILDDADAALLLTSEGLAARIAKQAPRRWRDVPTLAVDALMHRAGDLDATASLSDPRPRGTRDDIALLQYTSGSTGRPRGVMVTHHNLLANCGAMVLHMGFDVRTKIVHWLPPFHDMGLVFGLLVPVYEGVPAVVMSPAAFLQRPVRWLKAIDTHQGTHSAAPNFAYDLCVQRVTPALRSALDLSSWRMACNGAEPVRAATLDRFAAAFEPSGFRAVALTPGYGLAEATLKVTSVDHHRVPAVLHADVEALAKDHMIPAASERQARALVGCGRPAQGSVVRIVDPSTHALLPEDRVGEIWVAGPSVARGYWRRPDESRRTFGARLGTSNSPERYLATGDLGFLHAGELFVTGRQSDLIIVRGQNLYPQDLEATACDAHVALRSGGSGAFVVEAVGEEPSASSDEAGLVIVAELERTHLRGLAGDHRALDQVVRAICSAVALADGVELAAVTLLRPASLPRTSSGKVSRRGCRDAFLEGRLRAVHAWRRAAPDPRPMDEAESAIEGAGDSTVPAEAAPERGDDRVRAIVSCVARALGVAGDTIESNVSLARYGLSSPKAVALAADLESIAGVPLPPTLLYEAPTLDALLARLVPDHAPALPSARTAGRARPRPTGPDATPRESIAVIGMACRFPGASSPEALWDLLLAGHDAVTALPPERRSLLPSPVDEPLHGAYLEDIDAFDAELFGIARREAEQLDPQHRILLEVVYRAFEDAGRSLESLAGSATGVFIGISSRDYERLGRPPDAYAASGVAASMAANRISYTFDLRGPSMAVDTACSSSLVAVHQAMAALERGECDLAVAGGVNLLLDPAVSTGFAAAGMLAPDGRSKAFDAAADGYVRSEGCGVVVLQRSSLTQQRGDIAVAQLLGSAVNQDGRSMGLTAPNRAAQEAVLRAALANAGIAADDVGYLEAHGTGTPLGDPIEAAALGAVFGKREPLSAAERDGDPPAGSGARCAIGSLKTHLGHMEAAAGIGGLMKAVLALQAGTVPPQLHQEQLNPAIDLPPGLFVAREAAAWPTAGRRIAGVSSFGFGGTNAHVVLAAGGATTGEATFDGAGAAEKRGGPAPSHALLPIATRGTAAREAWAADYANHLAPNDRSVEPSHVADSFEDVVAAAAHATSGHRHRLAVVACDAAHAGAALRRYVARCDEAGGDGHLGGEGIVTGRAPAHGAPRLAFFFAGQGGLEVGVARELVASQPRVKQCIDEADAQLADALPRPLADLFAGHPDVAPLLRDARYAQPALFTLQIALSRLWAAWGLKPTLLIGHSLGELAAACVAGVLDFATGLELVAARARLIHDRALPGTMMVIHAPPQTVENAIATVAESGDEALNGALDGVAGELAIAAYNGPRVTVVSGSEKAVTALADHLRGARVTCQPLPVSHAFHSAAMAPVCEPYRALLDDIALQPPQIEVISTLDGQVGGQRLATSAHWVDQLRQPVRFEAAVRAALAGPGFDLAVELGPQPSLTSLARRIVSTAPRDANPASTAETEAGDAASIAWLPSLRTGKADSAQIFTTLGEAWVRGANVDWKEVYPAGPGRRIARPTYPFQRQRYWRTAAGGAARPQGRLHSLLDEALRLPRIPQRIFQTRLAVAERPWLAEHRVRGDVVVAGACQLAMMRAVLAQLARGRETQSRGPGPIGLDAEHRSAVGEGFARILHDVCFQHPLVLPDESERSAEGLLIQLIASPNETPGDGSSWHCELVSLSPGATDRDPDSGTTHATARLSLVPRAAEAVAGERPTLDAIRGRCRKVVEVESVYADLAQRGAAYGPAFRWIRGVTRGADEALAELMADPDLMLAGHELHSGLLDGCFQTLAVLMNEGEDLPVPFRVERVRAERRVGAPAGPFWAWARRAAADSDSASLVGDVVLFDADGGQIAHLEGCAARSLPTDRRSAAQASPDAFSISPDTASPDTASHAAADRVSADRARDQWLYEVVWRPRSRRGPQAPPDFLPAPSSLGDALQARMEALAAEPEVVRRAALESTMETSAGVLAAASLGSLCNGGPTDAALDLEAWAAALGVVPGQHDLLARLFEMAVEDGLAQRQDGDATPCWRLSAGTPGRPSDAAGGVIAALAATDTPEGALLARCGRRLTDVLTGRCDPLHDVLFASEPSRNGDRRNGESRGGDAGVSAATLYRDAPAARAVATVVVEAVGAMLDTVPINRPLRVLEVGAGTGGTTAHLLPTLPADRVEYQFTDVSSHFTQAARAQFGAHGGVSFSRFDVEHDPVAQGLTPHGFDVVLASNVLHATRDLRQSLEHVHRLLAPGGMLVLIEGTRALRWLDLVFGLTPGWWRFADRSLRPDHPLVTAPVWQRLMAEGGFDDVAVIGDRSASDVSAWARALGGQTIFLARAATPAAKPGLAHLQSRPQPGRGAGTEARPWLLVVDEEVSPQNGAVRACALALQRALALDHIPCRIVGCDARDPNSRLLQRALSETGAPDSDAWAQVVDLRPLATPRTGDERETGAAAFAAVTAQAVALTQALIARFEAGAGSTGGTGRDGAGSVAPQLCFVTRGATPAAAGCRPGVGGAASTSEKPGTLIGPGEDAGLAASTLMGLVRTLGMEHPELGCRMIDLDAHGPRPLADAEQAEAEGQAVRQELRQASPESIVAYRDGRRLVPRLVPRRERASAQGAHALQIVEAGSLDGLALRSLDRRPPAAGEVEIEIAASGLSFRDVLNVLGLYGQPDGDAAPVPLGSEAAGTVVSVGEGVEGLAVGDRVATIAPETFASHVCAPAALTIRIADDLSFDAAATVPVAFATVAWGLEALAALAPGERVLIHAAAGGVGQAAIQLAQQLGCEIHATAHPDKHAWLAEQGIEHLYSSRSPDFGEAVLAATGGAGVDVVLDALSLDFLPATLVALAPRGRLVEIGREVPAVRARTAEARPDVVVLPVDLAATCHQQPEAIGRLLHRQFAQLAAGDLAPLPYQTFPLDEAREAFRTMQHAHHRGKIVLTSRTASAPTQAGQAPQAGARADTSRTVHPDRLYVITGGTGGLGRLVARWLVDQGARQIALVGRRGSEILLQDDEIRGDLEALRTAGAHVQLVQADVADREGLEKGLARARQDAATVLGHDAPLPIAGAVHAAGVLADALIRDLTWEHVARVLATKAVGGWNLHALTHGQPLDFFVLFASAAGLLGSPGQANHAAANTFLDALAHHRRGAGLPALAIDWGPWREVGAAEERGAGAALAGKGMGTIGPQAGMAVFAELLATRDRDVGQVGVLPVDWPRFLARGNDRPFFDDLSVALSPGEAGQSAKAAAGARDGALRAQLASASPRKQQQLLKRHLRGELATVLGVNAGQIETDVGFFSLGLDSLTSVELRNRLQTALERPLPSTLLFDHPTVDALTDFLVSVPATPPRTDSESQPTSAEPSDGVSREVRGASADGAAGLTSDVASVVTLSEAEAEASLLRELEELQRSTR